MDDVTSLAGPVEELLDGRLVLQIPLSEGGAALAPAARGIGQIEGEDLVVVIPAWLAEKLGIGPGSTVIVDNRGGKFNMTRAAPDEA